MLLLLLISVGFSVSCVAAVAAQYLALISLVDGQHRLRCRQLLPRLRTEATESTLQRLQNVQKRMKIARNLRRLSQAGVAYLYERASSLVSDETWNESLNAILITDDHLDPSPRLT